MFTPPESPVVVRGSAAGPLSAYLLAVLAWGIVLWGVGRSNLIGGAVVLGIGVLAGAIAVWFATGAAVELDPNQVVVRRRLRPVWRSSLGNLTHVVENIPARPRMPSLAGWTFRTRDGETAQLELALFAPADRRRLRRLFDDLVVDADAGLRRR
ncbi:hypothetical protein [Microbacterium gorillae]|uniref:hypothetical protein n=1 Tax=Microbacterium gorillae TaxID=1231063 RepID=UPI00058D80E5|nr:hypothetical protein [Microbacterium gorillae]